MGNPKKQRKKYSTPSHPWQKERILAEKELLQEYGLNRKYEIWKMNSILKNFTRQAKGLIATKNKQADKESRQLLTKLSSLGLISKEAQIEEVLSLSLKNVMERRLQTLVYRKSLASSARQARQFIVHAHIALNGKTVTAPSYLVPVEDESGIGFSQGSVLSSTGHPQRAPINKEKGRGKAETIKKERPAGKVKSKKDIKEKKSKPSKDGKSVKKAEGKDKQNKESK